MLSHNSTAFNELLHFNRFLASANSFVLLVPGLISFVLRTICGREEAPNWELVFWKETRL